MIFCTDAAGNDIDNVDVLSLDLDFADGKDFEIIGLISDLKLKRYCYWYVPDTGYGGIVDNVVCDYNTGKYTATGRSYIGIINSHVIDCDNIMDLSGKASDLINSLFVEHGLDDVFHCDDSEFIIDGAMYDGDSLYESITNILSDNDLKLVIIKSDGIMPINVYVEPIIDMSDYTSFCGDNPATYLTNPTAVGINHVIAKTTDGNNTYKIDIYSDPVGHIRTYANGYPYSDDDYILDNRYQVLKGSREIAKSIDVDYDPVIRYVLEPKKPKDWARDYSKYYTIDDNDNYVKIEPIVKSSYVKLTSKPVDWDNSWGNYFQIVNGEYVSVGDGSTYNHYKYLRSEPSDWKKNYENYFIKKSNGSSYYYESVKPAKRYKYFLMEIKPSDWDDNYENYFDAVAHQKNTNPEWKSWSYCTREEVDTAPSWSSLDNCYRLRKEVYAPQYLNNSYYKYEESISVPSFSAQTVYRQVYDNYNCLVKEAISTIKDSISRKSTTITINDNIGQSISIGDVVGAYDEVGNVVEKAICRNIIFRIADGKQTVQYLV